MHKTARCAVERVSTGTLYVERSVILAKFSLNNMNGFFSCTCQTAVIAIGGKLMNTRLFSRRMVLTTGAAATVVGIAGRSAPAWAQGITATPSMRGGSNNICPVHRLSRKLAAAASG